MAETAVFQPRLSPATRENRDEARKFLNTVNARGGTELARLQKAMEVLDHAGGDIFILTDGQVAGTEQFLAEARAAQTRLHCLGIGYSAKILKKADIATTGPAGGLGRMR